MPLVLLESAVSSCNLSYLAAAFAVSWVGFFIYVFFITRRQQEMGREIAELRHALEQPGVVEGDQA